MSSKACQNCGGTDIDRDAARGDAVCTSCGTVLEDNIIVANIQFEENAYGGATAIGQFVGDDSQGTSGFINAYRGGGGQESREMTMKKARNRISTLAHQLRLNQHCIDMACNFYKMALCRHLTHGRKNPNVVAACIYITCRTEGTPHLLIDIADIMDIDVYQIGHTYMQLAKALCINVPSVDPCVYVMRFANRMGFGDDVHEVSMTALRLVQRMKRDWIDTGRRPSGLCGAALLIAARMHGFNRSLIDVIKEVKVHESTVRKRLTEFGETPTSSLTLKEFMTVDLEEEQDPPCLRNSRKKELEKLSKLSDPQVKQELEELEQEIDRQLTERQTKSKGLRAKSAKENLLEQKIKQNEAGSCPVAKDIEQEQVEQFITEETLGVIQECLIQGKEVPVKSTNSEMPGAVLRPPPDSTYLQLRQHLRPTMASLGISDSTAVVNSKKVEMEATNQSEGKEELDLTGIDDEEIDSYLLTDAEASAKASMWMTLNGDFLKELEKKRKRKEEEEEEKLRRGKRRKIKHNRKPRQSYNANTPEEAIGKMLVEKRISSKINYDVLKNLNSLGKNLGSTSEASTAPTAVESKPITSLKPRTLQPTTSTSIKMVKSGDDKITQAPAPAPAPLPPPVFPEDEHEQEEEEEEEEEEEYNTADICEMSAADLLNGHGQDDYGDEEDYY